MIDETTFAPSKSSGNPMLTFKLSVVKDEAGNEHTLFYRITIHDERGKSRLKRVVREFLGPEWLSAFRPRDHASEFNGLAVRAKVRVRKADENFDEDSNEVREIHPDDEA